MPARAQIPVIVKVHSGYSLQHQILSGSNMQMLYERLLQVDSRMRR